MWRDISEDKVLRAVLIDRSKKSTKLYSEEVEGNVSWLYNAYNTYTLSLSSTGIKKKVPTETKRLSDYDNTSGAGKVTGNATDYIRVDGGIELHKDRGRRNFSLGKFRNQNNFYYR